MGGMGSGARRSTHIGNVEDVPAIDIRALRRLRLVEPGECMIDTVCWSIDGLGAPSVRLRIDLSDMSRGGTMIITGNMHGGVIDQRIAIEAVPSGFGGWRCYFVCPITAKRCEVIYLAAGRFASRDAHSLTYATQNMTDLSRARHEALKHRRRLNGVGFPRPRGRNRIETVERLQSARRNANAIYFDRLSAAIERSATRRTPGNKR